MKRIIVALLLFVLPFILFANTMTADTTYYIRKDGTVVKGFVHRPTISIKLINDTVVCEKEFDKRWMLNDRYDHLSFRSSGDTLFTMITTIKEKDVIGKSLPSCCLSGVLYSNYDIPFDMPTLYYFWMTTCVACFDDIRTLDSLVAQYPQANVCVVVLDDRFLENFSYKDLRYVKLVRCPENFAGVVGSWGFPISLIVDTQGKVVDCRQFWENTGDVKKFFYRFMEMYKESFIAKTNDDE